MERIALLYPHFKSIFFGKGTSKNSSRLFFYPDFLLGNITANGFLQVPFQRSAEVESEVGHELSGIM